MVAEEGKLKAGKPGRNSGAAEVRFDAVLHPHRSLGPTGFLIFMLLLSAVSFATGVAFLMMGAWPVFGFFGLDVLLVYVAFRINYRSGRLYETLKLTRSELEVNRIYPSGARECWTFQPYWLRIHMDDPPQYDSKLILSSHGRSVAIGSFLSLDEKIELARALAAAIAGTKRPEPA